MPGDTPMPFMSVKGAPATWARVGDTIRVVRLKPYGREFDYVVESVDRWGFAVNRTDCRGKGNGEYYGEYPGDYAVVSRAAPRPSAPAPAPLAFDAALAALDVEHYVTDKGWRSNILGLDAVRSAHRAEVERAVAEEREAIVAYVREACGEGTLLTAQACAALRVTASAIEGGCRALNNQRAAIRARGVAKPRTDGEAPAAADEGAKS